MKLSKYEYNGEEYITNMDMDQDELKELTKVFHEVYDHEDPFYDKAMSAKDKSVFEAIRELEEMLEEERVRLTNLGILKKGNLGRVSSTYEGEAYIDGLNELMLLYLEIHGYKRALYLSEEIDRLDHENKPHMHAIYVSLCAYFEDEQKIKKVCKNCNRPCIIYFMSMMVLYFKRGNFDKAKEFLNLINSTNNTFIPFFQGKKIKGEEAQIVLSVVKDFDYLFDNQYIKEFIKNRGNV